MVSICPATASACSSPPAKAKRLFVAARESNEIAVVDLATGDIARTALGPEPYHLTVAQKAGRIYVSSAAESKLWALDAKTLATVAEIPIEGEGHQMAVH
jgi:DNA-binding beta-propeller fold protein YncE